MNFGSKEQSRTKNRSSGEAHGKNAALCMTRSVEKCTGDTPRPEGETTKSEWTTCCVETKSMKKKNKSKLE